MLRTSAPLKGALGFTQICRRTPARDHNPLMELLGVPLDESAMLLLGVAGAALAWLVQHRLSVAHTAAGDFRQVSTEFRSAVLQALDGLYPVPSNWPGNTLEIITVLKARFPALQIAVAEFRPHLPWYKRLIFDRAWRIYRLGRDGREIDGQYYWQYIPHISDRNENGVLVRDNNEERYQGAFRANVDRLLRYAR